MPVPEFLRETGIIFLCACPCSVKFTVSLDGFSGQGTCNQVISAAMHGSGPTAKATEWEMAQLLNNGRLSPVRFIRNGKFVNNPFGRSKDVNYF